MREKISEGVKNNGMWAGNNIITSCIVEECGKFIVDIKL